MSALDLLDLCAGAGGMGLGAHWAGLRATVGVELDPVAASVYLQAVGEVRVADLWEFARRGPDVEPVYRRGARVVAAGLPCQSHSVAGARAGMQDARGQLYVPMLEIATAVGAEVVVVENVRGIRTSPSSAPARWATAEAELRERAAAAGYAHQWAEVLLAADYGVAQLRHRWWLVAFRSAEALARWTPPAPTHGRPGLPPHATVRQALTLPPAERYAKGPVPWARGAAAGQLSGMRMLNVDAPAPTVTSASNPEGLFTEAQLAAAEARGRADRPSSAVTATEQKASANPGPGSWPGRAGDKLGHRLTVAQCAALQGFPPGWPWQGKVAERYRQVGNAVPPALAAAVLTQVKQAIEVPQ